MSGPSRWEKLGERVTAETRILEVRAREYRHPVRGTKREFVVVSAPDWVNVVAVTPDGKIVLITQFRYGVDDFTLEIPGGVIDKGEDPVTAGVRELREETGYVGKSARLLGSVHSNPAIIDNRTHIVLVEEAVQSAATEWGRDEEIGVSAVPVEEVMALGRNGRISHALVLNALFLFEPVWRARRAI